MFNGYHEPPATSYNDLELDRGKKSQGGPKWPCGNGAATGAAGLQSTHMHPQNHHQPDLWSSKSPFIGLPNAVTPAPKCSCPSCYQIPENQSYQGDIAWRRSWFSRTYPVPVSGSHDLVKLPGNHHWEGTGLASEAHPESMVPQYGPDAGEKALYYKPYVRHADVYQPGVISTMKTCKIQRKEDGPHKHGDMMVDPRYSSAVTNPGYDSFRTGPDRRRMEDGANCCNQGEKYLEPCRQQQGGAGAYHLHANVARRPILEPFAKTVPLNPNQNRVPSVSHRTIKDNMFQSYIEQGDVGKVNFYNANQAAAAAAAVDEKHCRALYEGELTKEQDNVHGGVINPFPPAPVDFHGHPFNRDVANEKDLQKYVTRNPQYFSRGNFPDVVKRNGQNYMIGEYGLHRKGVVNQTNGGNRIPQAPHSPPKPCGKFKDCSVADKISPDLKLVMNHKDPMNVYTKGEDIGRSENVMYGHVTKGQVEPSDVYAPEKGYNRVAFQGCRRPEYGYGRRGMQPYDYSNGTMNLRSEIPVTVNQEGMGNFQELRNGLDGYPRPNNNFAYDGLCHQYDKLHFQVSGDDKPQFVTGQPASNFIEGFGQAEKEKSERISHLESIRQEQLCKNGTSKISPLRLLRKKKFIQQKTEGADATPPTTTMTVAASTPDSNPKNATPPLDVRRFWATWAEEEEESVPQTQMVVLDCHNIDPEQAGLLHLYNSEPIRAVHLEDGNLLDVKSSNFDKSVGDERVASGRGSPELDNAGGGKGRGDADPGNEEKPADPEFPLGMPVIAVDPTRDAGTTKEAEDAKRYDACLDENRKERCRRSERDADDTEPDAVLSKVKRDDWSPHKDNVDVKEESAAPAEEAAKEPSSSSDCSDDSQTGDLPSLPDLPTSEYRKNKFLDYSEDAFCSGSLATESVPPASSCPASKETPQAAKARDPAEVPPRGDDCGALEPSDGPSPGSFEIDEILQKLSDINFKSPDVFGPDPEKHKTDKKALDYRRERKPKKSTHKSSRTDQLTLQNISLAKPTIKFSIQKSHDLKISFKVLNNKKKKESLDEGGDGGDEDAERGYSSESGEDAKTRRRLITLKLKGLSEGKGRCEEDGARKIRKALKRKKMRSDRSPSPKTPVLKIKKSRYMAAEGSAPGEGSGVGDDVSRSSEGEGASHDDFQVHETVDSAKIKLTFKRNKNSVVRKGQDEGRTDCRDSMTAATEVTEVTESETSNGALSQLEDQPDDLQEALNFDTNSTINGDEDMGTDMNSEIPSNESSVTTPAAAVTPLLPSTEDITYENVPNEDPLVDAPRLDGDDESGEISSSGIGVGDSGVEEATYETERSHPTDMAEVDEKKEEAELCDQVNSESLGDEAAERYETKEPEEGTGADECWAVKPDVEGDERDCSCLERQECGDMEEMTVPDGGGSIDMGETIETVVGHEESEVEVGQIAADENSGEDDKQQQVQVTNQNPEEAPNVKPHVMDKLKSEILVETKSDTDNSDAEMTSTLDLGTTGDISPEERPEADSNNPDAGEETSTFAECAEPEKLKDEPIDEGDDVTFKEENADAVVVDDSTHADMKVEEFETVEDGDAKSTALTNKCEEGSVKPEPTNDETDGPDTLGQMDEGCWTTPKTVEVEGELVCREKNNNNVDLMDFLIDRKVSRRCSCSERAPERTKVRDRSKSLTIELTVVEAGGEVESSKLEMVPHLDICVWDIPLPAGDPPPGNCLDFVEYFKSKMTERDAGPKGHSPPGGPAEETSEDIKRGPEHVEGKVASPVTTETSRSPADGTVRREVETSGECGTSAVEAESVSENRDAGHIGDPEAVDGKDEVAPGESLLVGEALYGCEGLAFDETLAIADDMEEEKVSDDDKFRDIMQSCLDNAKKFLSVGNLKLLSRSAEDLSEEDPGASRVPRDVLLASRGESGSEELSEVPSDGHQLEISVDFVPSFLDGGSTLCSEVLPVDNWPYLEEEVASSPLRSKADDSDLLSSCLLMEEEDEEGVVVEEDTSPDAYVVRKLTGRSRRVSEGSHLVRETERSGVGKGRRRKTIEGVCGCWRNFESSSKEQKSDESERCTSGGFTRRISGKRVSDSRSSRSGEHYRWKPKRRASPCGDGAREEKRTKDSDYNSSSWQPKVVLFRISKNVIEDFALSNSGATREGAENTERKARDGGSEKTARSEARRPIPNGRDSAVAERGHRIGEVLSRDAGKMVTVGGDGGGIVKRKKHRFRNLHTKKRFVPDNADVTKRSTPLGGSHPVDSESDSSESCPDGAGTRSQSKSTKPSSSTRWDESHGATAESCNVRPARKCEKPDTHKWHPAKHGESKKKREEGESRRESENRCDRLGYHRDGRRSGGDGQGEAGSDRSRKPDDKERGRSSRHRFWVCEVCGFNKASERATHIQSHPFHCQSCHLAFKTESNFVVHLTRKHKDIRNQHHCLLCELSFDLEKDYHRHLETREHKHLESVEKNTINTLFTLLTGRPCPVLGPVEARPEWLPSQAGTVHFYHQATPLSLALQYLKLHHDRKTFSTAAFSPRSE